MDKDRGPKIKYETYFGSVYDLVHDPYQRSQMMGKLDRETTRLGRDEFKRRLSAQAEAMEGQINSLLQKWFTLKEQLRFIELVERGELPDPVDLPEEPAHE